MKKIVNVHQETNILINSNETVDVKACTMGCTMEYSTNRKELRKYSSLGDES
jgi:hypothetical protein